MALYRSKPILVEAIQYTGDNQNIRQLVNMLGKKIFLTNYHNERRYAVSTEHSIVYLNETDWIVMEGNLIEVYDNIDFKNHFEKEIQYMGD